MGTHSMRAAAILSGLLALSLLSGCTEERAPGPPVALRSFVLHDVQGYYGGRAIWASEDRTAIVQVVGQPPAGKSGLWEKRYKVTLPGDQWAFVERLVGVHHFLTLKIPKRPAVPDEAHPIIVVVTKDGMTTKAMRLADDRHDDFDPLYQYLVGLCRSDGEQVYEGAFDWDWLPDGFERPW